MTVSQDTIDISFISDISGELWRALSYFWNDTHLDIIQRWQIEIFRHYICLPFILMNMTKTGAFFAKPWTFRD